MILNILLFIFILFFVFLVIGASILFRFLRVLGFGKKSGKQFAGNEQNVNYGNASSAGESVRKGTEKKKIFDKTDGEYIDYEDV